MGNGEAHEATSIWSWRPTQRRKQTMKKNRREKKNKKRERLLALVCDLNLWWRITKTTTTQQKRPSPFVYCYGTRNSHFGVRTPYRGRTLIARRYDATLNCCNSRHIFRWPPRVPTPKMKLTPKKKTKERKNRVRSKAETEMTCLIKSWIIWNENDEKNTSRTSKTHKQTKQQ